jgi:hypothetical protein
MVTYIVLKLMVPIWNNLISAKRSGIFRLLVADKDNDSPPDVTFGNGFGKILISDWANR